MPSVSCTFVAPFIVPLPTGLELRATGGAVTADGRHVTADIELWNGSLRHQGTVKLWLRAEREGFISDAGRADPAAGAVIPDLARALSHCAAQLPVAITATATANTPTSTPDAPPDSAALLTAAGPLPTASDLLDQTANTVAALGVAGEQRTTKLLYLALTSRLLERPVSVIIKAPSSAGKSFVPDQVLKLFPESAYLEWTHISPQFLARSDNSVEHRFLVLYEAGGISGESGAYNMRSLLSEGKLTFGSVNPDTHEAVTITKEGPTGLLTTTTHAQVDGELETRLLSIGITDTPQQTRAVMKKQAAAAACATPAAPPDLAPWLALQEWLAAAGERRVVIPYADALADLVPNGIIRMRRDFGKLLSLITACAVLHQQQRARTVEGAIIATVDDYGIVYDLLAESFSATQQDGITPAQREAVEAVATLNTPQPDGVTLTAVAGHLDIDKSAAGRRLANPLRAGYVLNLTAGQKGKAAAYVPGEALPPPITALPAPSALATPAMVPDLLDVTL